MRLLDLIKKWLIVCYSNRAVRYVFFGGLTTLVNLAVYFLLRRGLGAAIVPANVVSVSAAILFAYFVNARFVFESKAPGPAGRRREFVKFVSARLSTMAIEVGGMWLLADVLGINDLAVKLVMQFVILVLNYVCSKFLVFKR